MKYLLIGVLLTMTAIVTNGTTAHAQALAPKAATPVTKQSAPLVTQPASLKPVSIDSGRSGKPYTADQLNGLLGTIQANPKTAAPQPKNSIESLIQRFSNSDRKPAAIDPIDFFKPPALDGGVKIPLQ
ncbi:hypothetical protein [Stenomitos frigidus]|uniref:Uncharacterized protein n=1 Tax=Stenomitos frigidus ULC18 TaxID=2107698 RepID=A0A2T1E583_9CYAN|nr:hypothetical protein [Stenomitos frigidus]PSB27880.1 hypothetical protein C7B82_16020 [Stenomitos frigidus ULC18]